MKNLEITKTIQSDKVIDGPISINHYYGNSTSSKANAKLVQYRDIKIYYSYETIIAIEVDGKLTIAKNKWKNTTAKHLNAINRDKSIRVEHEEVLELAKQLKIIKE